VESGFPSENATNAKMLERCLFPVCVKPLWLSQMKTEAFIGGLSILQR
jgi:hypothetical protein